MQTIIRRTRATLACLFFFCVGAAFAQPIPDPAVPPATAMWLEGTSSDQVVGPRVLYGAEPEWSFTTTYSASPASINVQAVRNVAPGAQPERMTFTFRWPPGVPVNTLGAFESLTGGGNSVFGSVNVTASGSCNFSGTGRISILDVAIENGQVTRLAMDFRQQCSNPFATSALYGELRINSTFPLTVQKSPASNTPSPFAFTPLSNAPAAALVQSNTAVLQGMRAPATAFLDGGEISVNEGAWSAGPVTVNDRDVVRMRLPASQVPGGEAVAHLSIGGFTAEFRVATYAPGNLLSGTARSGSINDDRTGPLYQTTIEWIDRQSITVRSQNKIFALAAESFTFTPPFGQMLQPGAYEDVGATGGWTAGMSPAPVNCRIARFSILELVYEGATLTRFAVNYQTVCGTQVIFGEVRYQSTVPFLALKAPGSTTPDPFAFADLRPAVASSVVTSGKVLVSGINAPAPIDVNSGEYSINEGGFTRSPGTVVNGDIVTLRATASPAPGGQQVVDVTIGGRTGTWTIQTYDPRQPIAALSLVGPTGQTLALTPKYQFSASKYSNRSWLDIQVRLPLGGDAGAIYLTLGGPNDQPLAIGTYLAARGKNSAGPADPVIDLTAAPTISCTITSGRFVVRDIAYGTLGEAVRLAVDFEATCSGGPTYRGEIRINSTMPMAAFEPRRARAQFDLDANGKSDILWQHTDGRQAAWTMDGPTQTGGGLLFGGGTGWSVSHVGDFNGDGKSDILWVHGDGRVALWLMSGGSQVGGALLLGAGTGWAPKLVADFNGDGRADIAWLHADGRSAVWLMNGGTQVGAGALLPAATGWVPKMAADFDGNGKADILWEHPDGSSALWIMDGTRQVGGGRLFAGGTGWLSRLVADLDGDGKSDIVWVHTDGRTAVWMMNGATQVGGAVIRPAASALQPVLAGDIDGDGRADIIWRAADGTSTFWLMNGTAQIGGGDILAAASGWTVVRVADFSGDRIGDLLLLHTDGRTRMDLFDGYGFVSTPLLGAGTGWTPVPVQ